MSELAHYDREAFGGVTNVTFCEALNAEAVNSRVLGEPWFRHCYHSRIDPCIEAVHKVAVHLDELRGWKAADAG